MTGQPTTATTIRRSIHVACPIEHAFETFTARMTDWWPLATHSIGEERAQTVVVEGRLGGRIYERMDDGTEAHWAWVRVWEPPHRLLLEWQVNPHAPAPTEIEVRFVTEAAGTRVDLEHRGWEAYGERAGEARASYETDWPMVLGRFAELAAQG